MKILSNLKAIVISIMVIAAIFYACRKIDYSKKEESEIAIREKFFTIKPGTDPAIVGITASIKRQDNKRDFIPTLIKKAGYPLWDKARISAKSQAGYRSFEEEQQVFIPFALENEEQTKAILIVKLSGEDTLYHLLYGTQYSQYGFDSTTSSNSWNGREVFRAFTAFDNAIYGHTKFLLKDNRLLDGNTDTIDNNPVLVEIENINNGSQGRLKTVYATTIWISYVVCGECYGFKAGTASRLTTPCCNATYFSGPVTFWFDDGVNDWGWFPPEGGGGGGSESQPCPGCNWEDTNPCAEPDPNLPQEPCDDQWQPQIHYPIDYNPLVYDSISVDHEIIDSNFQCLYDILKNQLADINRKTQLTLFSVFDVPVYNHVHFKMNWEANANSDYVMRTTPSQRIWIDDNMHFYDTIEINPYFAANASREVLIATSVHESIHAYINWCLRSYHEGANGIDSNYLKTHFPIHWEYIVQKTFNTQHDLMVNNYINEIVDAVIAGGNQNSSIEMRRFIGKALGYAGLKETSVWKTLQDTCLYKATKVWGENYNQPSNWHFSPDGCGNYPIAFRDSLQLLGPCN